jgi:hypothetical protein
MCINWTGRGPLASASAVALSLLLAACSRHEAAQGTATNETTTPRAAAQRIYRDAETGRAREPTPAELTEGQAGTQASLTAVERAAVRPGVDEVHLPDGTVGVRVAQQYYHTIVVCRRIDGSFSTDCPPLPPAVPARSVRP